MPRVSDFEWTCPGCGVDRAPGSEFVHGPDPYSTYGPLCWDVECLRHYSWLREEVTYRPIIRA